ncbi:MAG: SgcJ/EcaC family oxidoreductase [Ferruginibacter sp.]
MKQLKMAVAFIGLFTLVNSCEQSATEKTTNAKSDSTEMRAKADPAQLKREIQDLETAWSNADNARDVNALAAFYADDAQSLATDKPMLVGNAAIKKDMEEGLAKRPKGSKTSYEVKDVYGGGDYATEVGTITRMDSTGKVRSTGKYMAIWEKRNGKWICIRDISNEDAKAK